MEQDEPVILVGHSLGGAVISLCAEICPQKIKRLVYIAAWLLKSRCSVDGPISMRPLNWAHKNPEAPAAQYEPVYTTEKFESIPRVYVRTTLDMSILPEIRDKMLEELPCERVYAIPSGHMVRLSKPDELNAVI
ncbi:MAG: hypothetical protein LUE06_07920 [Oscillospiraceae bacterium]|nr:hypothetical protein [Oscillospiraceae bacterium]